MRVVFTQFLEIFGIKIDQITIELEYEMSYGVSLVKSGDILVPNENKGQFSTSKRSETLNNVTFYSLRT